MRSASKRATAERSSARIASGPAASARATARPLPGAPGAPGAPLRLRLYIAGKGPNSMAALANLEQLLAALRPADYDLEIVDCLREPLRALRDGVLVTPTLLRVFPTPIQTVVGTLSSPRSVRVALGLPLPNDALDEASDD